MRPTRGLTPRIVSDPQGAGPFELQSGSKDLRRAGPALPSYLALLHAGFAELPILLPGRWALTPPFHPYLCGAQLARERFCLLPAAEAHSSPAVYFLWHFP